MNVYFVRHGVSEGNLNKTHQGENAQLSSEGVNQVTQLAVRLRKQGINAIYASPYLRTKQSAEILAKELDLPVECWNLLKERRRPSEVEGLRFDDPKATEIYEITKKNQIKADWKYSDDESYNELLKRAKDVEQHLISHHQGQNVICVSHIGIIMIIVLQIILQDKLTPKVFWQFYYHSRHSNTGITLLEYSQKSGWNLIAWNDTAHL
jgi:probable phosphoglycerate mutase